MNRSTLFSLALKAAGLSMQEWVHQELKPVVSTQFVYAVLAGDRSSARVDAAIDRLIKQQGPRIRREFAKAA